MSGTADRRPAPAGAEAIPSSAGGRARLAVVMPGYLGTPDSRDIGRGSLLLGVAGCLWRSVTSERYRGHVRLFRDFYANPRPQAYMLERVGEFIGTRCPAADVGLWSATDDASPRPAWAGELHRLTAGDTALAAQALEGLAAHPRPDAVLLVHPDAIGLGQEPIERAILRNVAAPVLVLNGRRRVYALDRRRRARLRRRRFMADTRLLEAGLGPLLWIAGKIYAGCDAVVGRRRPVS
jgi:hypothetical protein